MAGEQPEARDGSRNAKGMPPFFFFFFCDLHDGMQNWKP